MKLIEAMKEIKALVIKAEDLRKKMAQYCAKTSFETSTYEDQSAQIKEWQQSHHDSVKRMAKLQVSIQKTNLATIVEIDLGESIGKVKHSIAEWILRRRALAGMEMVAWQALTDKNIKEGRFLQTDKTEVEVKIVRFYDPKMRDTMVELYRTEPGIIDRTLETVNAVTDLIEA